MDYKDGDTITVNGKPCRIEGGALVPVVQRGPLGGELVPVETLKPGQFGYTRVEFVSDDGPEFGDVHVKVNTNKAQSKIIKGSLVETNIPPRPTFTPMSAGEAAALPDIVGRWVAVKVDEGSGNGPLPLSYGGISGARIYSDCQVLLIEGADLP